MSNNEIEVKLVLDQSQLKTTELSEDLMDQIKQDVCECPSLESAIESYIENGELYYLPDTVSELQDEFGEYDFMQMQDDLNRDEEAIHDLKDRVKTIEEKLSTEPEASEDSLSVLALRVKRLEQINERLLHIIHNVQGVDLP